MMGITTALSNLGRPVAYYPSLAKFTGSVNAAILLSQFMYWRGKGYDGEIHKTNEHIANETGLSADECRTAVKKLTSLGLLTVTKKGLPACNHYQFHWAEIDRKWDEFTRLDERLCDYQSSAFPTTGGRHSRRPEDGIPDDIYKEAETTTETTTKSNCAHAPKIFRPDDMNWVETEAARDFIAMRKAKKAPMTQTAWKGMLKEFAKAGITPQEGVEMMLLRGWQGFKAEWMNNQSNNGRGTQSAYADNIPF